MNCHNCGVLLKKDAKFCDVCGYHHSEGSRKPETNTIQIGYSKRIHDPSFAMYVKNNNRWSAIFSVILSVATVMGFYIYGETSSEMDNPQAMYIGFGIGTMFLLIAIFQIFSRKRSKTWDGVVVDKIIKKKSRRQSTGSGSNDYYINYYTEFTVMISQDNGKKHFITTEEDDTVFNYFNIGDRLRHHSGLNSYEKYDKSKDNIIFCNACGTLCHINDEMCFRCKCPLLK